MIPKSIIIEEPQETPPPVKPSRINEASSKQDRVVQTPTKKAVHGVEEVGYVVNAQDYLMHIEGLPSARVNDIIIGDSGNIGYVTAILAGNIEAQILEGTRARPGDKFTIRDHGLALPTHVSLFGRIINPIGKAVDLGSPFPPGAEEIDLDTVAPGIHEREHVHEQFYTGIIFIDTLLPVGKGQRELIFGDARSGKDLFLTDVVLNQKGRDVICIYVSLGKSDIDVRRLQDKFKRAGADSYTVILAATSSEAAPMVAIAPLVGCSLGEHYAKKGKSVLVVVDDLGTHAKYLREINLLAGRIPGRESYPANIFYEHSQMVERAGNFLTGYGGGNITMLPVVETDMENMTNLIPTNVMSMTDGHILFLSTLHAEGRYPAAEASKSVTRVGKQTQMLIHKVLADKTMALLTEYAELERFSRFGSDLAEETQRTIIRGKVMQELVSQQMGVYIEAEYQILLLGLVFAGYFDNKDIPFVHTKKMEIIEFLRKTSTFSSMAGKIKDYKFPDLIKLLETAKGEVEKGITFVPKKDGSENTGDAPPVSPPEPANSTPDQAKATTPPTPPVSPGAEVPATPASNPTTPPTAPDSATSTTPPLPLSGEVKPSVPEVPTTPPAEAPKKGRAFFSILGRKK